jgi:hypothetical protein
MNTRRYALVTASSTFALLFSHTGATQTPESDEEPLEQVVVTGTRVANRSALDTAVPVDVVSADQLQNTGVTEVNQALSVVLPSFNFPRPGLADGTDTIRPATLRGLAPDQTLVLVNGKRRHSASLVNVNGTVGRGSSAVDLNTIPNAMVQSIEVLRDGASAQYGSDAIAGVLNLRLREQSDGGDASVTYGWRDSSYDVPTGAADGRFPATLPPAQRPTPTWSAPGALSRDVSDGETLTASVWKGLPLGESGFVTVAAEYKDQEHTERGGWDARRHAARPALDPVRRRRLPVPERPGQASHPREHREPDAVRVEELQRELVALGQQVEQRSDAVQPHVQPAAVEPELHERQHRSGPIDLVHRAGERPDVEQPGAHPFEVARLFPVQRRRQQPRRREFRWRGRPRGDIADEQFVRDRFSQQPVDVAQVAPEQVVEFEIVVRRVVVAVPPEPVAAFGDENLFPGLSGRRGVATRRLEGVAGFRQLTPGEMVVAVSDPDVEVAVDPRAGEDAVQLGRRSGGRVAHGDCPQLRMGREPRVQGAEKRSSTTLEMLPGVFAVQDDWNGGFSPAGSGRVTAARLD